MKILLAAMTVTVAVLASRVVSAKKPNVLFLMCDSMDGRVMDPRSPVYERLEMPNLRRLMTHRVNCGHGAASPQCVPSRTTMFAGDTFITRARGPMSKALPACRHPEHSTRSASRRV